MRIYVAPVSGNAFPVQLAYISILAECGIKPDLVFGSSGGNVVSYIGLAAGWDSQNISKILLQSNLNSTVFASSWFSWGFDKVLPSWILGYFKGSIYACGTGVTDTFQKMFTAESIVGTEIWSGSFDRDLGKGQMFCNREQSKSIIKAKGDEEYSGSLWSRDILPLCYLDGNIETISKVAIASASIPILVPSQKINGHNYADGGSIFASPLTALQDYLYDIADTGLSCHIDYINSYDIQSSTNSNYTTIYDNGTLTLGELVKSLCISDRLIGIDFVRYSGQLTHYCTLDGTIENLKIIENIRRESPRSLLEMYPNKPIKMLDLIKFTCQDILSIYEEAKKIYKLRFWWSGKTQYDSQLVNIKELKNTLSQSRIL